MTVFETEDCGNCIKVDDVAYGNDSHTCSGIVRNASPKYDVIRLCQIPPSKKGGKVGYVDMTLDEALDDSWLLSKAVSFYVKLNQLNRNLHK